LVIPTRNVDKSMVSTIKLVYYVLSISGVLAFVLSIIFNSSVLAFIGLGCIFWAAIFAYVRPEKRIKKTLMDSAILPLLENTDTYLSESGCYGKGVYLPPKFLKDAESSVVLVPSTSGNGLLRSENVNIEEIKSMTTHCVFIVPPGKALSRLFEEELHTSFIKTSLNYVQEKLPPLLVDVLEVAEAAEIAVEKNIVTVELKGHVFEQTCQKTRGLKNVHEIVGCPLCSAIACSLAKATGKPVEIKGESQHEDSTLIQFLLMEDLNANSS
jgi:hypothetical protein